MVGADFGGEGEDFFAGLAVDYSDNDQPVLVARRVDNELVHVSGLSEGTRDQLFLSLRLSLLERRSAEPPADHEDFIVIVGKRNRIGFIGFSLGAKAAVYVAAFAPEIAATVALDPHIAINGATNWYSPWYLEWTPRVLKLLNPNPARPGFEHDHHELLALTAPRPFLLIGGAANREDNGGDSDDRQSKGYVDRAREVYKLLGVEDRLEFALTSDGHKPNGPTIDPAWQKFFERWLGGVR
jgi:pimeloyl-ACP methyl ester carboxylesterase